MVPFYVILLIYSKNDTNPNPIDNTLMYQAGLKPNEIQWEGRTRTFLTYST